VVNLLKNKPQRTLSVLTIFVFVTLSLETLILFLLFLQGTHILQLSRRKPPNFVQLVNGKQATVTDNLARDPEAIRQFISKIMLSMFNWSGNLPPQTIDEANQPKPDLGILIVTTQGSRQRINTTSWIAGFALSEDFRKGFLSQIADLTPPEIFSRTPSQAMSAKLTIKRIYQPEEISPGQWRVGMIADITQKRLSDNRKVITPFNKDILVRAIDSFTEPLANSASDLQKAIYSVRNDKLEIYEIRDLCLLDEDTNLNKSILNPCLNQRPSGSFIK
jgi:hypothetical protein